MPRLLKLESPILNDEELAGIEASDFKTESLSTLYQIASGPDGLKEAVSKLCQSATAAVEAGVKIIILSDRCGTHQIGTEYSYIPPLLAVGAVHHHYNIIHQGLRLKTSLVSRYRSMLEYPSLCLFDRLRCFSGLSLFDPRKRAPVVERS